jgi:MFS family permease
MTTPRREPLPVAFRVWVCGALASQLGDSAMYFALGWAASARGGTAAGLVLSAISLPRTLLLLLGGAVGDRLGARRVMITGDGLMLVVAGVLGVIAWLWGTPLAVLIAAGLIIGTVDAFYLPSAGSMPRRLVDDSQLSRAVALRQSGSQLVSMVGGPVGGLVVAAARFAAAAWADSATFAIVLVVLILIRGRAGAPPPGSHRNVVRDAADGVRIAVRTPGLGAALLLVAGSAGFIIPVSSLLIPLLARTHGWGAGAAGLVIGAQGAGAILVTLVVARRGTTSRPGLTALAGLLTVAAGQAVIGLAPAAALAATGALGMGLAAACSSATSPPSCSAPPPAAISPEFRRCSAWSRAWPCSRPTTSSATFTAAPAPHPPLASRRLAHGHP